MIRGTGSACCLGQAQQVAGDREAEVELGARDM